MNKILCCIPARYESSRLPGKPLLYIGDKTIINRTYEQASKTKCDDIVVLTDDERIYDEVTSFGGNCAMVTTECINGTDRIISYINSIDHSNYDIIVNVQGDEPFIDPTMVDKAIDNYYEKTQSHSDTVCSTLCYKTKDTNTIKTRSKGKSIVNDNGDILYCSRNIIPGGKKNEIIPDIMYNIHIGIFVYNKEYLINEFCKENTYLQLCEDIEWLKIIEQGYKINTIFVEEAERGIDTQEDYEYLKNKYL